MIPLRNGRYGDKETLKQHGAWWKPGDPPEGGFWYVPDGRNPEPLKEFMDADTRTAYDLMADHFKSVFAQQEKAGAPAKQEKIEPMVVIVDSAHWQDRSAYEKPADFKPMHFTKLDLPDDFVALDTETTGLHGEVVELSVVDSAGNEKYHSFFEPSIDIVPQATAVSGLCREFLKGQPSFVDEWPKIVEAIGGRRIAGHNIGFDQQLIKETFVSLSGGDHSHDAEVDALFKDSIDSKLVATKCGVPHGERSLNKIIQAMGYEAEEHRTSSDCLDTLRALQGFEQGKHPAQQQRSVERAKALDGKFTWDGYDYTMVQADDVQQLQ